MNFDGFCVHSLITFSIIYDITQYCDMYCYLRFIIFFTIL